jgi:N-acetylglucosamine-6-phosphate deacetylase
LHINGPIDLHTHGIGSYDTRTNKPEDILKIAELHGKAGTAGILPTIYSGTIETMRRNMEAVKKAIEMQDTRFWIQDKKDSPASGIHLSGQVRHQAACILGVHLEGPFLNFVRCGALDKKSFISPALSSLKKLISGYEDIIKIITIAPEIKGALKIIEKCCELGINVNIGHSDATYQQAVEGKKAGVKGITHFFNAMRPFHHREPGIVGLGLMDEELYLEIIADGIHIHPQALQMIFNKRRLDKIILVSDSVKNSAQKKSVSDSKRILSGSSITLPDSNKILKNIGIPEAEITEAMVENPSRYLSL